MHEQTVVTWSRKLLTSRMPRAPTLAWIALGLLGCSVQPTAPSTITHDEAPVARDRTFAELGREEAVAEALDDPLVDPVCQRTESETREGIHQRNCHPHEHGPLRIEADADTLPTEAIALVDELAAQAQEETGESPSIRAYVMIRGGPGAALVRDALLERGLTCDQVYTLITGSKTLVEIDYVCGLCCLL